MTVETAQDTDCSGPRNSWYVASSDMLNKQKVLNIHNLKQGMTSAYV